MTKLPYRFGASREAYLRGVQKGVEVAQGKFAQERGLTEADMRALHNAHALFWSAKEEQSPHTITVPDKNGADQTVALADLMKDPETRWMEADKFVRLYAYGSHWPEGKHAEQPADWPAHLANFHPDDIGRALLGLGYRG